MKDNEIVEQLGKAILEFDAVRSADLARKLLADGIDPIAGVQNGVIPSIKLVGIRFGNGELFLPELVQAANSAKAALDILQGALQKSQRKSAGKLVLGTVEGDIHDIGKNLVSVIMSVNGWEVFDIGVNCPPQKFLDKALEVNADIIGASALLTVTVPELAQLIRYLEKQDARKRFKVIVGGAAVSKSYAESIGADGYAEDAQQAVACATILLGNQG